MAALLRRELLSYYAQTGTWVLLAANQLILAWLLLGQLETFQRIQPQLTGAAAQLGVMDLVATPTLSTALLLLLVIVPLLGMRAFAGELDSGRIALLLSAPIGPWRLALGKWLGLWLATLPFSALTVASLALLGLGTELDGGRLAAAAIGLAAMSALAAAVTVSFSSLTRQGAAAAAAAAGTLLLLWVLGAPDGDPSLTSSLSLSAHLQPLLEGLVRGRDLGYFAVLTAAALLVTAHRLAALGGR